MTELLALIDALKGPLGGTLAVGVGVAFYLWTNRGQRQVEGADSAGTVKAIAIYQEMLANERTARQAAEERADKFAAERNEAYLQLGELKGQLAEMARQLERQSNEMQGLREQIHTLEEQINAKA